MPDVDDVHGQGDREKQDDEERPGRLVSDAVPVGVDPDRGADDGVDRERH